MQNPNFDFYTFNSPDGQDKPRAAQNDTAVPTSPASSFELPARPTAQHVRRARRAYSRAGWAMTVLLLVWYTASVIAQILGAAFGPALLGIEVEQLVASPAFSVLTGTLPLYVFGVPALALLVLGLPTERPPKQRFGAGRFVLAFFISLGLALVGNFVGNTLMSVIGGFTGYEFSNLLEQTMDLPLWMNLVFMVVLAPLFEELIFRKLLLDRLRPYGELGAILISSLLFGAIHGNFYQFFYAALLGALLAYVYLRSGSFFAAFLLHALFNFFGGVLPELLLGLVDYEALLAVVDEQQLLALISENMSGFLLLALYYVLFYLMAFAGLILLLVLRRRLFLVKTSDELPRGFRAGPLFGNGGMIAALLFCAMLFLIHMVTTAQPLM